MVDLGWNVCIGGARTVLFAHNAPGLFTLCKLAHVWFITHGQSSCEVFSQYLEFKAGHATGGHFLLSANGIK